MNRFLLLFLAMAVAASGLVPSAQAAGRPSAGVEAGGVLALTGTGGADQLQVTRYSALPPGEDPIYGAEVPVYSVSAIFAGVGVSADSSPGACWEELETVYCRADGIRSVSADLRSGDDSLLIARNLRLRALGGAGNDSIYGGTKDDALFGGPGRDYLQGEGGNDRLSGGAGADKLIGDKWRDAAFFKPYPKPNGRDRIEGGSGPDTIQGGAGSDRMLGGPGADSFENNRDGDEDEMTGGAGRDTVRDPDYSYGSTRVRIHDGIYGCEWMYLEYKRYRLTH